MNKSIGTVVKLMDLSLGSTPAGTHMSHQWQQEEISRNCSHAPFKVLGSHIQAMKSTMLNLDRQWRYVFLTD